MKEEETIVGSAGIKGMPVNGAIEIPYGTIEAYRRKCIGTGICKLLILMMERY